MLAEVSFLWPERLQSGLMPVLAGLLALLLALPWLLRRRGVYGLPMSARLGIVLCLSLGMASAAVYVWSDGVPIVWPYVLVWLAMGGWLWAVRETAWGALLVGLLALLLGLGLVAQLQLGVGAEESKWLDYGIGNAALAGAFCWLFLAGLTWFGHADPDWPATATLNRCIGLLALLTLALLGLQAGGLGNEAGLWGVQPLELTKLALVIASAYALAQRSGLKGMDLTQAKLPLWWRYLGPTAMLGVFVLFALGFLRDFSPIVLLFVWLLVTIWAYLRVHEARRWRSGGQALLAILAVTAVLGVDALKQHPEWFPEGLQSERIQVWADPDRHPHTGFQLSRALEAIRAGGWTGVAGGGDLRKASHPGVNGKVMAVPAIQDDFAPAFFLHRYGGVRGLALLAGQILLVLILFRIAGRALYFTKQNDYRLETAGWFAYFALYGGGGFLAAHFLVSWGTNLGFLPVMGQPMPLLSAAGSHLVLFVLPIMALATTVEIALRDAEQ